MNKKGFAFTMDTAYAVFIILIAATTVVTLMETTQQSNEESLYLSRIAGDINTIIQLPGVSIAPEDVTWLKVNDCTEAEVVGTHKAVIYDNDGNLMTNTVEVCPP